MMNIRLFNSMPVIFCIQYIRVFRVLPCKSGLFSGDKNMFRKPFAFPIFIGIFLLAVCASCQSNPSPAPKAITPYGSPSPTPLLLPSIAPSADRSYCDPPQVFLPDADAQGKSQDELARGLMDLWLSYYADAQSPGYCRIGGYTIDQVSTVSNPSALDPKSDLMRSVKYSILLVQLPNQWMANAGEIDAKNWLHTANNIAILHLNGGYTLRFAYP
jgi:hypothetical protein